MIEDRDEKIRRRAHEIWRREGEPHGRHTDHWDQARREIEAEEAGAGGAMAGGVATPLQPGGVKPARTRATQSRAGRASASKTAATTKRSPRK